MKALKLGHDRPASHANVDNLLFERITHDGQPARSIICQAVQEAVDMPLLAIGRMRQL
jgi:hypothetical protein